MRRLMAGAVVLLAACASQPPAPAPDTAQEATDQDTCGIARFRHLIGTPAADIDRATLPPRTRIITPEMAVTMDFSVERLNIMVGTDGIVGSMRCF
jgi:PBP1b-binding outer membrane lipoprotein LpoB